jgi:hypothetical protein
MGLLKKAKGLVGKVLGAPKKAVKKLVPKELAGIMQAAAPFVAASNPMAALALTTAGQYKQRGRISPLQTALSLAPSPQVRGFTRGEVGLFGLESLKLPTSVANVGQGLDTFLYGAPSGAGVKSFRATQDVGTGLGSPTQGLIGKGGEFGLKEFTKGSLLSPDGKLSKARVAGLVAAGASLATAQQQIEEEAVEAGITSESTLDDLKAEAAEIFKDFDTTAFRPNVAEGGLMRTNYALGSRPTAQESGLGGLPIEADMRYTGGFMPYGAREKADDVPARLSKNEFVFTADAVRAAGGGNINKGARRMYNTMKQLESMGRA